MKDYAAKLYKTKKWQDVRNTYAASKRYLCERCLSKGIFKPGEIVHHKIRITPENIDDPAIALNFDNLELLCRDCHAQEHSGTVKRYKLDPLGRVILPPVDPFS